MCHAVIVPRARLQAGALAHKLAYVTFSDEDGQKVALHLTNQLFLDQYLVIEAAESVPEDLEPAQGHPGTDTLEADLKSTVAAAAAAAARIFCRDRTHPSRCPPCCPRDQPRPRCPADYVCASFAPRSLLVHVRCTALNAAQRIAPAMGMMGMRPGMGMPGMPMGMMGMQPGMGMPMQPGMGMPGMGMPGMGMGMPMGMMGMQPGMGMPMQPGMMMPGMGMPGMGMQPGMMMRPAMPGMLGMQPGAMPVPVIVRPPVPTALGPVTAATTETPTPAGNVDPNRVDEIRRTLYVGNLGPTVDENKLLSFFGRAGQIKFVRISGDLNAAARFAFIEFTANQGASTALQFNQHIMEGRPLKVNLSKNAVVKSTAAVTKQADAAGQKALEVREAPYAPSCNCAACQRMGAQSSCSNRKFDARFRLSADDRNARRRGHRRWRRGQSRVRF